MNKSERIRQLASEGLTVSQIAQRMQIRYQHAYGVLKKTGGEVPKSIPAGGVVVATPPAKPDLSVDILLAAGFVRASQWRLDESGFLISSEVLPKSTGVYAFARDGLVMYVGVATMGLAKRLYFYAKPSASQRTSWRLNETLRAELASVAHIDILIATPEDMEWNGLPVHGSAGLELGIIKKFALPWNMRSAR